MESTSSSDFQNDVPVRDTPSLSTRRKRRKTKRERNKKYTKKARKEESEQTESGNKTAAVKSRTSKEKRSVPVKSTTKSKEKLFPENNKGHSRKQRIVPNTCGVPMIYNDVTTVASNRITQRVGMFDKLKASDAVFRGAKLPIPLPHHVAKKSKDELRKILDIEGSNLDKAVDISKLNSKRISCGKTIRLEARSTDGEEFGTKNRLKTNRHVLHSAFTCSSDSSAEVNRAAVSMDVDEYPLVEPAGLPEKPDYSKIVQTVREIIREKNVFGDRDMFYEIQARLRTLHKGSTPPPAVELTTPLQRIPTSGGRFSSEVVKRSTPKESRDSSGTDSDISAHLLQIRKRMELEGGPRPRQKTPLSGVPVVRCSKDTASEPKSEDASGKVVPMMTTAALVGADALMDANNLLHLNDASNRPPQPKTRTGLEYFDPMEEDRRPLAPITNVMQTCSGQGSHHWQYQGLKYTTEDKFSEHAELPGSYVVPGSARRPESRAGSRYPQHRSAWSNACSESEVISSNQNVVAQYTYPAAAYQTRRSVDSFRTNEDPFCFSSMSVSSQSQETCRSMDAGRSRHSVEHRRHPAGLDGYQGSSIDSRRVESMDFDLLDFAAEVPPPEEQLSLRPRSSQSRRKRLSEISPSPPPCYPMRLVSK